MLVKTQEELAGYYSLFGLYRIKTGDYCTPEELLSKNDMIKRLESYGYDVLVQEPEQGRPVYNVIKRKGELKNGY